MNFCALRAKAYACKLDDDTEMKKAKGTKKCIVKREITFKNYADALFNDEVIIRSQQRFRSDHHRVYTEEVNKIALSSNDDKRVQLRLVELNKIDTIIDEALNVVWNGIYGENRINPEMIKIDKHKDIDGYVSKLADVINNKIESVNKMCESIDHVMSEMNETNKIDKKIYKASEMDNDTLYLISDKLQEIINQSRKNLRKIVV